MFRLLGILFTVLFAIATAVVVWPQFFHLEQTFPFAQIVAARGVVLAAFLVIAALSLLLLLAKPLRCLLYTSPSPRDRQKSRMPSSA